MARLPWGGASTGWSAEFVGGSFIESDRGPWARRFQGAAFPEGRCFRANGSGGHCLGGTSTGSSAELPEGSVIESDRGPWARRSQGYDVPGGGFRSEERRVGKEGGRRGGAENSDRLGVTANGRGP